MCDLCKTKSYFASDPKKTHLRRCEFDWKTTHEIPCREKHQGCPKCLKLVLKTELNDHLRNYHGVPTCRLCNNGTVDFGNHMVTTHVDSKCERCVRGDRNYYHFRTRHCPFCFKFMESNAHTCERFPKEKSRCVFCKIELNPKNIYAHLSLEKCMGIRCMRL